MLPIIETLYNKPGIEKLLIRYVNNHLVVCSMLINFLQEKAHYAYSKIFGIKILYSKVLEKQSAFFTRKSKRNKNQKLITSFHIFWFMHLRVKLSREMGLNSGLYKK